MQTIKDWPPADRPREKLLDRGANTLSDTELLAIFLRTGCAGKSAVDLARELLQHFGGLRPLLETDETTFCQIHGLGRATYAHLQASLEIARRLLAETLQRGNAFTNTQAVKHFVASKLRHRQQEVFGILFLNSQHQLLMFEELFVGTIDEASVYPREVVKKALAVNAAAVIFTHNHPSGIAEPSDADKLITQRLKNALGLVDIRVLDHMIVGDKQVVSFAERGMLSI